MRFGLFSMAEYVNMITLSALCVTLFFGGWVGPWRPARPDLVPAQGADPHLPLHLAARDAAPASLRPADVVRLEGAPPGGDAERARDRGAGGRPVSPQPLDSRPRLRRHAEADLQEADHAAVPGIQAAGLPALPRPAPALAPPERAREMRRLLALRGRLPGRLHPCRRRGEHRRQPRLGRRALRADLRDQPLALHLLRLLRARMPVRRDHARAGVRDLRVLARRPHLHEGHAARRADQARAGGGSRPLRHADPGLQGTLVVGDVVVWAVWIVAAFACLGSATAVVSFANPYYSALSLIGNLGSLAVLYLLLSAEFVAAAQVLVYAGAVMVMFLFVIAYLGRHVDAPWVGGPSWQALGAVAAAGALMVEIVIVIGLKAERPALGCARDHGGVRQPAGDRRALPHRPPARVRDHLDRAPRRRRGRGRPRQPRARRGVRAAG